MAKGDHIKVGRGSYTHHGIDYGDGTVAHFTGEPGRKDDAAIRRTSMREFADGARKVEVVPDSSHRSPEQVVQAAEKRIGETGYDLLVNNCEHFASDCRTGKAESFQAEQQAKFEIQKAVTLAVVCGTAALAQKAGSKATLAQKVGLGVVGLVATGIVAGAATWVSKIQREAEKQREGDG
jgi:Lecithin retinol acyltransferase